MIMLHLPFRYQRYTSQIGMTNQSAMAINSDFLLKSNQSLALKIVILMMMNLTWRI